VGVLAPASRFDPKSAHRWRRDPELNELLAAADQAASLGFPATALHHLKEAWSLHWFHSEVSQQAELKKRLSRTYRKLGRALLARRLDARYPWVR